MLVRPVLVSALAVAALTLAGCGSDDSPSTASDTAPTSDSPSASGVSCDYPATTGQPAAKEVDPPPASPTATGKVAATISTTAGDLKVTLDADATPCTVNSFISLAEQGYYDDTSCHRLVTSGIHVLQCGDPTGTGTGGPGYTIEDELTGQETYPAGTLAMARTQAPDSGGSQFFIVYGDTPLDPAYTVFGTVDEAGIKTIEGIAEAGVAGGGADGAPAIPVAIKTVTVD